MKINERDLKLLEDFLDNLRSEIRGGIAKDVPEDAYTWRQTRDEVIEQRVDEAVSCILFDVAADLARKFAETEG